MYRDSRLVQAESGLLVPAHLIGAPPAEAVHGRRRFYDPELQRLADLAARQGARASLQGWQETLISALADGPALTAAAAASAIQPRCLITLPNNYFEVGRMLKVTAQGRISNVVTTPGTGRFDIRFGAIVVYDTGAFNLNVVAKTNVPFWLEIILTCRAVGAGTSANLMGVGSFQSESVIGSPANTAGGNGSLLLPVGAPTVGNGFNSTSALTMDLFWTQTVATGSMTVHQYKVESIN